LASVKLRVGGEVNYKIVVSPTVMTWQEEIVERLKKTYWRRGWGTYELKCHACDANIILVCEAGVIINLECHNCHNSSEFETVPVSFNGIDFDGQKCEEPGDGIWI
jgi:hypothetical protein